MRNVKNVSLCVLLVALVGTTTAAGAVIYVDADAIGANDGSSWANAYNYLQDALTAVSSGDEIWVAEGTNKPDQGATVTAGDRFATFQLINGVAIYGGFPPGGGNWEDRDPIAYETILSGDLAGDDAPVADPRDLPSEPTRAENSYHVVTGSGIDATAVLDGFTITAGNANGSDTYDRGGGMYSTGSSPTLTNCTFSGNAAGADPITTAGDDGGGMYSTGDPTLTNCMFSGNAARDDGGGMCSRVGSPTLTNCTFTGNSAQSGAGMYNRSGSQKLTNCTFTGNSASPFAYGGGMYNDDGSSPIVTNCTFSGNSAGLTGGIHNAWYSYLTLTNCILWGNSDPGGTDESAQVSTNGPQIPLINYCCIQGWTGTGYFSGSDNIGDDPLFVDADGPDDIFGTEDDDLRLSAGSSCIDAADGDVAPTADILGNPRYDDPHTTNTGTGSPDYVDIGAYEFRGTSQAPPTLSYVTDAGNAVADVTWQPPAITPQDYVGFAWDFYTGDWVTGFSGSGMWYWFGGTDQSGQMNLGRSGAYAVWISSSYSGGGLYPCDNPWVGIISSGQPHQPINVAATELGNRQVSVNWKTDVFGTANYWLIAYKIDAPNQGWISVQGPIGNSVWQYTAQGASEATLTMPYSGDYWIFLFAGGWDGQWSDATPVFASP